MADWRREAGRAMIDALVGLPDVYMTRAAEVGGGTIGRRSRGAPMIFVHALGTAQIDAGTARVKPTSVRRFALLLYLAAEAGRRVSRTTLHELICPDQTERNARHTLRELLYQLRQAGVPFVADTHGVELPRECIRTDYGELVESVNPDEIRIQAAGAGFFPGFAPTHSEAFIEWYEAYRARSVVELCRALLREMSRAKAATDWVATERTARACLALDPLNEAATLALAEVLAIAGSRAQAVKILDDYSREVGTSAGLQLPATILKRRISERLPSVYGERRDTPFLGRANEIGYLMEHFDLSRGGLAQGVVCFGEAGIGKTRLIAEFSTLAALRGAQVHTARVQPHDVHRPLSAFIDLLPSALNAPGALGCSPRTLSLLRGLCSNKPADQSEEFTKRPSEEAFYENLSAIGELVDSLAHEAPLVLVIDDIHWLDPTSISTIANLVSGRTHGRLMIALTSRPNDQLPAVFRHADPMSFLRLERLDSESANKLVLAQMADLGIRDDQAASWIRDASNGNPLFAHMLVSHFGQTRVRFDAPPTLRSLLTARVQQLSDSAQALLSLACLLGRHCSLSRITAAADIPSLHLMTALSELERAHLLRGNGNELHGPHALVIDAALAAASNLSIVAAHRRIAQLLEGEAETLTAPSSLWDAADHWIAAGDVDRGVELLRRCAKNAADIGRPREAADMLIRAACMSRSDLRRSILLEATRAAAKSGEYDVILRASELLRGEGWLPDHDELELAELNAATIWREDPSAGERLVACIESPTTSCAHKNAAALALLRFANISKDTQLAKQAWRFLEPVVHESNGPVLFRLSASLTYHLCFGDFRELPRLALEAVSASEAVPPPFGAQFLWLAGLALMRGGQAKEAFPLWQRAYTLARSSGLARRQFEIAHSLRSFANDAGLHELADEWTPHIDALCATYPEFRDNVYEISYQSDLAAMRQSLSDLQQCYRNARRVFGDRPTGRVMRWMRAMEWNIALLGGKRIPADEAIASLIEHHEPHSENGDSSDFEIATAIRIATAARKPETARLLLKRYLLEYRQNLAPFWSCLREAIRSAGLADEARDLSETLKNSTAPLDNSGGSVAFVA